MLSMAAWVVHGTYEKERNAEIEPDAANHTHAVGYLPLLVQEASAQVGTTTPQDGVSPGGSLSLGLMDSCDKYVGGVTWHDVSFSFC